MSRPQSTVVVEGKEASTGVGQPQGLKDLTPECLRYLANQLIQYVPTFQHQMNLNLQG
jgi:hypothetical protein